MNFRRLARTWAVAIATASPAVAAEPVEPEQTRFVPHELQNTGGLFLTLEFVGSAASFAIFTIAAGDPAESCGWCESNDFDRSVRDALRASDPVPFGTVSHVMSLGVAPVGALGSLIVPAFVYDRPSYALADSVIVIDAFMFTTGLATFTKVTTARERPAFHYGVEAETEAKTSSIEQYLSFPSGDTAWAFSLGSSAATLSYLRGYPSAPYVAAGGALVGVSTGVLRIAADMHWATDVIAGATLGTASGMAFPLLLHRRARAQASYLIVPRASTSELGAELLVSGW